MVRVIAVVLLGLSGGILSALLATYLGVSGVWLWVSALAGSALGIWGGVTMKRPWDVVGSFVEALIQNGLRLIGRNIDVYLPSP